MVYRNIDKILPMKLPAELAWLRPNQGGACVADCKDYKPTSEERRFYSQTELNLAREKMYVVPMCITKA
jgi:hypothetical protein